MSEHGRIDAAATRKVVAEFLQSNEFESQFVEKLLETFIRVCGALKVSDPNDPLSSKIARTLILIATEGERDPDQLFKRTLNQFNSNG